MTSIMQLADDYARVHDKSAVLVKHHRDALKSAIETLQSAVRTLEHIGYTNHGGEYWQPPVGKAPKALVPLTDDQKNSAWDDHWSNPSIPSTACSAFYAGMRFAEKHHGIGGTP